MSKFAPIGLRVLLIVAAFALIVLIVVQNLATAFTRAGLYPAAYLTNRQDGIAAGLFATALRDSGAGEPAVKLARLALAQTPLSAPALNTVAMWHSGAQERLIQLAQRGGWRDAGFHTFLAERALSRGDFTAAALHADAAARVTGLHPASRRLVDRVASTAEGRSALARRLSANAYWRAAYIFNPAMNREGIAHLTELVRVMEADHMPVAAEEKAVVVLLNARQSGFLSGYGIWKSLYKPDVKGGIADPGLADVQEDVAVKMPFGWQLAPPVPGIDRAMESDEGGRSLHLNSDGSSTTVLLTQLVALSPGIHRLHVRGRFVTANDGSAFRWGFACWGNKGPTSVIAPIAGVATGAADFSFAVPGQPDCALQSIMLSVQQSDHSTPAEGWVQHVAID